MNARHHIAIDGWFDWELTYQRWARMVPLGGVIVEVGCFKGKSLTFLVEELQQLGRSDVYVHAVDNWAGVKDVTGLALATEFLHNLGATQYPIWVHSEASVRAAQIFETGKVDFVWIDGSHEEADVYADLCAWWPTVKYGGEMGGHDYSSHGGVQQAVDRWCRERNMVPEILHSCCTDGGPSTDSWLLVKGVS
jgi:Methyltransferase domain